MTKKIFCYAKVASFGKRRKHVEIPQDNLNIFKKGELVRIEAFSSFAQKPKYAQKVKSPTKRLGGRNK